MKIIFAMLLALAPMTALAQDSVAVSQAGLYTQFSFQKDQEGKSVATPRAFFDGFQAYTESCGGWMFAYGENRYGEAVVGGYCSFLDYVELALGAGLEGFGNGPRQDITYYGRAASGLRIGTEERFIDGYYERGHSQSEDWFQAELGALKMGKFDFGLYAQKGDGFGPRARVSVPFWDNSSGKSVELKLWAAPMYGFNLSKLGKPQGLLLGGEVVAMLRK